MKQIELPKPNETWVHKQTGQIVFINGLVMGNKIVWFKPLFKIQSRYNGINKFLKNYERQKKE